jgi:hypothetical protein
LTGHATAVSQMILPNATSICINSLLVWDFEGAIVAGEDQDVWPLREWREIHRGG